MPVARKKTSCPVGISVEESFISESPQAKLAIAASIAMMPAVLFVCARFAAATLLAGLPPGPGLPSPTTAHSLIPGKPGTTLNRQISAIVRRGLGLPNRNQRPHRRPHQGRKAPFAGTMNERAQRAPGGDRP